MSSSATGKKARTQARLIEATYAEVVEKGFATASLDAIARRAGMTKGAIYSNYRDKAEIGGCPAVRHRLSPLRRGGRGFPRSAGCAVRPDVRPGRRLLRGLRRRDDRHPTRIRRDDPDPDHRAGSAVDPDARRDRTANRPQRIPRPRRRRKAALRANIPDGSNSVTVSAPATGLSRFCPKPNAT